MEKAANAQKAPAGKAIQGINPRMATGLLGLCIFGSGAAGLVNEYVLATVSTYILGNSIEQFSVIIAVMMLMMGVGGFVQRFVSDRHLLEKFILIEAALALMGGFAPTAIYAAFGLMDTHFALIHYGFVGSIGFLIGMEIPLVLRINKRYVPELRSNLSVILSLDYVGSFVGALVWTYLLLRVFPLTEIGFIVAGSNFLVAAVAFIYFTRHCQVIWPKLCLGLVAMVAAVSVWGYSQNRAWNLALEQRLYDEPIVLAKTTKYQRLVVTHDKVLNDYRLYINGNVQFSSLDEERYHESLVHPVMHAAPQTGRVLILGGGDGLALRQVLKYRQVKQVTLVDLDPAMTEMFTENKLLAGLNGNAFSDARVAVPGAIGMTDDGWAPVRMDSGKRDRQTKKAVMAKVADVQVFNLDADRFIGKFSGQRWNVVLIDFPDPGSVELAKLYSKEFYLKLRNRVLAPDGLVAIQATSPYHAKEAFLCIRRTLEAAGFHAVPYHQNVPAFGDWGWFLAWPKANRELTAKISQDIRQRREYLVPTRFLTPDVFRAETVFGKGELTVKSKAINTLMNPVLLDMYVRQSWLVD